MDVFGNTDPKRMPKHFLWNAISVDYKSAMRASIDKQNYSVCPRHWYIDAVFKCVGCGESFTWRAAEQKAWFEDYCFWVDSLPRHCRDCRAEHRHLLALRREYDQSVTAARDHGTPSQKRRIVEIVSELEMACGRLPEKMMETKALFERQIKREADTDKQSQDALSDNGLE